MRIKFLILMVTIGLSSQKCKDKEETMVEPPTVIPVDPTTELPVVDSYLTTANGSRKFEEQQDVIDYPLDNADATITINSNTSYQEIDGFGFALTGGSAGHINNMSETVQDQFLDEVFGLEGDNIGMSYIRISIGASDLDANVFSYNDLPSGEIDIEQTNFSIEPDRAILLKILSKIVAINPEIKIMATPWSPPVWMKTGKSSKGGQLMTEYYESYALYLAKYIQAMEQEGIPIESMSVQNEPLHPGNNPSMSMSAEEQLEFIKTALGPKFEELGIDTKIILYDHNADRPEYPLTILADDDAYKYVDGSGFHLYGGDISALSQVRNAYPDKNIYFTEQWYGAPGNFAEDLKWHIRELVIGATRNWSKNLIEWNLTSAPDLQPRTDGGCTQCLGGITISGDAITRNAGYYVIAHASKFVRPESQRIESNYSNEVPNVAFRTPDNQIVLILLNNSEEIKDINIVQNEVVFSTVLDPGSVATYVWDN